MYISMQRWKPFTLNVALLADFALSSHLCSVEKVFLKGLYPPKDLGPEIPEDVSNTSQNDTQWIPHAKGRLDKFCGAISWMTEITINETEFMTEFRSGKESELKLLRWHWRMITFCQWIEGKKAFPCFRACTTTFVMLTTQYWLSYQKEVKDTVC